MLQHIAIIMDGNGRWAQQRGLKRTEGHMQGAEVAWNIVTRCLELGIPYLTLYAFSKENWKRPLEETRFLFDLLVKFITRAEKSFFARSIQLNLLGELEGIPQPARQVLERACNSHPETKKMTLNLAINYSARDEIARALRLLLTEGQDPAAIDSDLIRNYLYTAGQPDPDIIIRTSGEQRLSNYLLFQSAYSELYFTNVLWPDFTPDDLEQAIQNFSHRNRRFGALG